VDRVTGNRIERSWDWSVCTISTPAPAFGIEGAILVLADATNASSLVPSGSCHTENYKDF